MNLSVEDILRLSSFLPVLLYLFFVKEDNKAKQVLFFFFLFVSGHSVLYALIDYYLPAIYSVLFNSLYIPVEFIIISAFFYKAVPNSLYKKFIKYISALFLLILSSRLILNFKIDFDSLINGIESVVVIFFSISFYYEQIKTPEKTFIDRDPFFWGISALFLFFSVSFFVFLFRESFWSFNKFYYQYIYIHALSGILRNIICSIAFLIKPYKEQAVEYS